MRATRRRSTRALIALDGTPDKARLGGNATIAVSMAVLHAAAAARRPAAVALSARGTGPVRAAAARDPDLRRRRACRAPRRHAGLHGDAARGGELRAGAGMDRRGLPRRRRADGASAGSLQGVADEGGWWPEFAIQRGGARDAGSRRSSGPASRPGDEVAISLDIAASEFGRDGRYRLALEGRELDIGRHDRHAARLARPLSDRLDRGPARRGRSRGHRARSPRQVGTACRSSATISWSPTPSGSRRGRGTRACNAVLIKPNQAGTVTETQRRAGGRHARAGWRHDRLRPLGRDRGRHHRPSRRRLGCGPAQGRLVRALGAHGEVERGPAHRGNGRRAGPLRRTQRAAAIPDSDKRADLIAINVRPRGGHLT